MAKNTLLFRNANEIINLNALHSKEGIYDNWQEAIEDVYVFINAQTETTTKLAKNLVILSENLNNEIDNLKSKIEELQKENFYLWNHINNMK